MADPAGRVASEDVRRSRVIESLNDGTSGRLSSRRQPPADDGAPVIQTKTYFVAAASVERGSGVAVMDEFTARACASEAMDYRPLNEAMRFDVIAAHLEDRPLSTVSHHFLECVRGALATR
ncbi:hypothetical protein OY671_010975 [Metschnikowia pulcherrima]|nr:hypothetical protein OY671_010975 [Metschnikowia pulcherrima]